MDRDYRHRTVVIGKTRSVQFQGPDTVHAEYKG